MGARFASWLAWLALRRCRAVPAPYGVATYPILFACSLSCDRFWWGLGLMGRLVVLGVTLAVRGFMAARTNMAGYFLLDST